MMVFYTMGYSSSGKEQIRNSCNNFDDSQKPYDEWKNPVSKGYTVIIYVPVNMTFSNKQYYSNGEQIHSCQGLWGRVWIQREKGGKGRKWSFFGWQTILYLNFGSGYMNLHIVENYQKKGRDTINMLIKNVLCVFKLFSSKILEDY